MTQPIKSDSEAVKKKKTLQINCSISAHIRNEITISLTSLQKLKPLCDELDTNFQQKKSL